MVLTAVACAVGVCELSAAITGALTVRSAAPVVGAAVAIPVASYCWGVRGLFSSFVVVAAVAVVWHVACHGSAVEPTAISTAVFIMAYVPLLAGFVMLILRADRGNVAVVTFVLLVVATDVGGYAAGARWGRTPMAPGVSPKKSWEGSAGSVVLACFVGAVCAQGLLRQSWWVGVVVALAVVAAAMVGDLAESLVKRDIGVKDLGSVLPGHGGVMERLDSMVVAAPVAYAALTFSGAL